MRLAQHKLPIRTRFVTRADFAEEGTDQRDPAIAEAVTLGVE
jgi:hypothetical protein